MLMGLLLLDLLLGAGAAAVAAAACSEARSASTASSPPGSGSAFDFDIKCTARYFKCCMYEFSSVQRLAFGWFGECSPALEHLLSRAADFGSQRLWQPMMAAS